VGISQRIQQLSQDVLRVIRSVYRAVPAAQQRDDAEWAIREQSAGRIPPADGSGRKQLAEKRELEGWADRAGAGL